MSLKIFGKSAFVYSIGTIAARISMFILLPVYTHYLSLDEYGLLSILLLSIQLIGTIIDFGLLKSLMRFVPEYAAVDKEGELLGSALVLNIVSGIVIILISLISLPFLFVNFLRVESPFQILFLTCIAALTQSIGLNFIAYFRARNDAKWYTILSILNSVLILALGFTFIVILGLGIEGALFSYILSYLIIIPVTLIRLYSKIKFEFNFSTFKTLAGYGYPLIFARSGDLVVSLIAAYMLSFFVSISEVGIYNLGAKIASVMSLVLILPFQLAIEPYVFNNLNDVSIKNNLSKIATYLLLVFFALSYFLIFISPVLISLIAPPEYARSYVIIIFLLPIFLFQGYSYFAQSLLHINKKSKITGTIVGSMTLMAIALNYFLIKSLGLYGIVLTANINYFFTALLLYIYGRREFPIKLQIKRLIVLTIVITSTITIMVLLKDLNFTLYLLLSPIIFVLSVFCLLKFGFFDNKEKEFLYSLWDNLNSQLKRIKNIFNESVDLKRK